MEFRVRYLHFFLVVDRFERFWIGSLYKNIRLMQEFLEDPFLILLFSYYALMTFLMTLTLILLSVLIMVVEHESYL